MSFWLRISAIAMLLALTTLFAISASRGFDFTDEGFYLINYLYWKDLTILASYFGFYLSLPFYLFGKSIYAMRLFGYFLLITCSYFCGWSIFRLLSERHAGSKTDVVLPSLILACCGINYFTSMGTLYTPSYNTLNLASILILTGLLFQLALSPRTTLSRGIAFAYGFTLSVCFFNKFSSSVVVLAVHLPMLWMLRTDMRTPLRVSLLAYAGLGFLLNIPLFGVHPTELIVHMLNGIDYRSQCQPRNIAKEMAVLFLHEIPQNLLQSSIKILPGISLAILFGYVTRNRKKMLDWVLVLLVAYVFFHPSFRLYQNRNSEIALLSIALWLMVTYSRKPTLGESQKHQAGALFFLLALPFAYSIGTDTNMLNHMATAEVFPFALCLGLLYLLRAGRQIQEWSYGIGLLIIGFTAFIPLLRPWASTEYTYQLGTSLAEQNIPSSLADGTISLNLDIKMAKAMAQYEEALRNNGFKPGMNMVDFTGRTGLVFAARGRVLASTMLGNGTPNALKCSLWLLNFYDDHELRKAWLLTSEDIEDTVDAKTVITTQFGHFPYEQVGEFVLPYANSGYQRKIQLEKIPLDATVKIWRPAS